MNTTNARVIRKYVDRFIPDHSMKAVYKWLKRYWLQLNAKDRCAFKNKMQAGYKIPAAIKRRAGSEKLMLDWSEPGRKKQKSTKGRKIYMVKNDKTRIRTNGKTIADNSTKAKQTDT